MRNRLLAGLAATLALAACSLPTVDKESDGIARALYEEVRTGADLGADPHLAPELRTPDTMAQLAAVRALLPPGTPTKVANRSFRFNTDTSGTMAELVHAYTYPGRTVIADTVLQKRAGQKNWMIVGFHVKVDGASGSTSPAGGADKT